MNSVLTCPFPSIETTNLEREQNDQLSTKLVEEFGTIANENFVKQAKIIAFNELPRKHIVAVLEMGALENGFKAIRLEEICSIDQEDLGDTPSDWQFVSEDKARKTAGFEFLQYLYVSLISYVIEIEEQRGGGACHDILPVYGYEDGQTGSSSHSTLRMHTEDTPLEHCCHYLSLLCVRNFEEVEALLCSVNDLEISEADREILRKPLFIIPPDPNVERSSSEYELKPILFGNPEATYIRVAFAEQLEEEFQSQIDPVALAALKRLDKEVERKTIGFVSAPGDLVLFSNLQCMHGRGSFKPNYDNGNTRWLKRMMGVDGLSSSLEVRKPGSRLITEKSN
jgi:hypothetical protein